MNNKRGFTLVEIIIVVIIMSLIATLILPRLFKKVESSKQRIAKTQIILIENAIKMYKLDTGTYPSTEQGLRALMEKLPDVPNWDGPYLEKGIPKDPWGRDYLYKYPGEKYIYEITSLGADVKPAGKDENKDIFNWTTTAD